MNFLDWICKENKKNMSHVRGHVVIQISIRSLKC